MLFSKTICLTHEENLSQSSLEHISGFEPRLSDILCDEIRGRALNDLNEEEKALIVEYFPHFPSHRSFPDA